MQKIKWKKKMRNVGKCFSILKLNWSMCLNWKFKLPARGVFKNSPVPVCTVSPGHWVNKADTQ